jgi:hypothetical protein
MSTTTATRTTVDIVMESLVHLLTATAARWTIEGWASHLAGSRHAVHAANSFVKHESEFGPESSLLWASAFVVTIARIQDQSGCIACDAAALIFERRAARAAKADPARLAA